MRNEEAKMSEIDRENIGAITGDWASGDVFINGKTLDPAESFAITNISPNGFSWGCCGDGSTQLALAILLRYVPRLTALKLFYDFRCDIISKLPRCGFKLSEESVKEWIAKRS